MIFPLQMVDGAIVEFKQVDRMLGDPQASCRIRLCNNLFINKDDGTGSVGVYFSDLSFGRSTITLEAPQ